MTTPTTPGIPCWMDMMTSDEAKTRAFYSELFGWTAGDGSPDFGGYFMFMRGDVPVAGCMNKMPEDTEPDEWTVYLDVEDARKTVEVATEAGSEVLIDAMDVADLGAMAVVTDAGGARVGLWQTNTFGGIGARAETGAQAWFELHTLNYDANVEFYKDVLGWDAHTMSDTPEFRYTTLGENENATAGIMDASGYASTSQWSVYISVEDTDASVAKAISLGGAEVQAAQDSPYGRLAEISDTTGCRIKLMGPNTES
jgi:hypothetical protein